MEQPSLRTKETGRMDAVRRIKKAALVFAAALAVAGPAGCKIKQGSYNKNVDCMDGVCGPLRLEEGEILKIRLPDNSEVIVNSRGKIVVPDDEDVEVVRDRAMRPEIVRARDSKRLGL